MKTRILRTHTFKSRFQALREHLRLHSPLAYMAFPPAFKMIIGVIEEHPHAWPIKHEDTFAYEDAEFHLAVIQIAYRRLHVKYYIFKEEVFLAAIWVDGQDEPVYKRY